MQGDPEADDGHTQPREHQERERDLVEDGGVPRQGGQRGAAEELREDRQREPLQLRDLVHGGPVEPRGTHQLARPGGEVHDAQLRHDRVHGEVVQEHPPGGDGPRARREEDHVQQQELQQVVAAVAHGGVAGVEDHERGRRDERGEPAAPREQQHQARRDVQGQQQVDAGRPVEEALDRRGGRAEVRRESTVPDAPRAPEVRGEGQLGEGPPQQEEAREPLQQAAPDEVDALPWQEERPEERGGRHRELL